MYLTGTHREIDALKYFAAFDAGMKVFDLKEYIFIFHFLIYGLSA